MQSVSPWCKEKAVVHIVAAVRFRICFGRIVTFFVKHIPFTRWRKTHFFTRGDTAAQPHRTVTVHGIKPAVTVLFPYRYQNKIFSCQVNIVFITTLIDIDEFRF